MIYVDNTPKKEYYVKTFNEPKNINHLEKRNSQVSDDAEYNFYNNLEGYLVGSSFEEIDNKKVDIPGKVHFDIKNDSFFVLLDDKKKEREKVAEIQVSNIVISEKEECDSEEDYEEEMPPLPPKVVDFKMTPVTHFYVGSLTVIGLLIFFRMLYRK